MSPQSPILKGITNMSMDKNTVKRVAHLSRIAVSDAQIEEIMPRLNKIMGFIEQLSEVDTENVEPLANVANIKLKMREDVVNDGGYPAEILKNAPEETQGFFGVPNVVE